MAGVGGGEVKQKNHLQGSKRKKDKQQHLLPPRESHLKDDGHREQVDKKVENDVQVGV